MPDAPPDDASAATNAAAGAATGTAAGDTAVGTPTGAATEAATEAVTGDATELLGADPAALTLATVADIWRAFLGQVPLILAAALVLLLTWGLATLVDRSGTRLLARWKKRESLKELLQRLVYLFVWVLGLLLAAIVLFPGLTPARALGGLGLVSIAVGLAFKDIFENFFAGILILWRFPFERGDFIECEGLVGKVERVLVRMSYIRQTSGELVVVPNSFLFKHPVTVLTARPERRVTVTLGVAYGEDLGAAVRTVERTVRGCESVSGDHPVEIFPQSYADSGVAMEVTWWTGSTPLQVRASRGEVVTAVKAALDAAGIEIPFPYRTLVFKEGVPNAAHAPALAPAPSDRS